ncbi:MAG: adenylosuccinate lyase [Gammaproteobacteria bacterium]|jgi:adenylosuccinate lyase|nr:adenylosuccinate lyase [Gammaproteobacteria bacterium]MBT5682721.1 adenylosuccinate lyase [Gammaproteobacteria bacterium]MBT6025231.1 adenylosuccinate lyase [Gammaproteobacteria bacterium]MBT6557109.1 adenylosuccinate lyase [Gammaproteobacteria bacterium]
MSQLDSIFAITAIDGRYRSKVENLAHITSEFGLIKYRTEVECQWVLFLSDCEEIPEIPSLDKEDRAFVAAIAANFDAVGATRIKEIEATTNHDVKAVEYYLKEQFALRPNLQAINEWVHFGCTSEDINNTAYGLMVKAGVEDVLLVHMDQLIKVIDDLAQQYAELPMLSRTHGQTASPTTLGKEMKNVAARLYRQRQQLAAVEILAKFNGAVGNFNAHLSAYPDLPWADLSAQFIQRLGLVNNPWTTQIEPHDYLAEVFHCIMRFNQIVLDFDRDIWSYISINYFKQRKVEGETGSSTMPHKINPIDFENSEGNIGLANALLDHMASKLPVSRWQRDLSDSTVLRNIGSAFAHCGIAYQATLKGLSRLDVNPAAIAADLDDSWEVLAEPVQTVMRKYGMNEPYEQLKAVTRGRSLNAELFLEILEELKLPEAAQAELRDLRPETYIGIASELAKRDFE